MRQSGFSTRSPCPDRELAPSLQRDATALESAVHDTLRTPPAACSINQPRGRSQITPDTKNAKQVTASGGYYLT